MSEDRLLLSGNGRRDWTRTRERDAVQRRDRRLVALLNASAITAIRTAAVSAWRPSFSLARTRASLRSSDQVCSSRHRSDGLRTSIKALESQAGDSRHCSIAESWAALWVPIERSRGRRGAVRGADLIVTATTAAEPILKRE